LNEFAFPVWVRILLHQIERLSRMEGWTIFKQPFIVNKLGLSVVWIRKIYRRLEVIGVLETRRDRRDGRNRHRINPRFWAVAFTKSFGPSFDAPAENSAVTLSDATVCDDQSSAEREIEEGPIGEPNLISSPTCARAKDEDEIISTFETVSGKRFDERRDGQALLEMKRFGLKAALCGLYATAMNIIWSQRPNKPQPQSLAYFLPQTQLIASTGTSELDVYLVRAKQHFNKATQKRE
jgi:hypothetical protein